MNEINLPISNSELEDFKLVGTNDDVLLPLSKEKQSSESLDRSLVVPIVALTIAVALPLSWYAFNQIWDHTPNRTAPSNGQALAKIVNDSSESMSAASVEPSDSPTSGMLAENLNSPRSSRTFESDYSGNESASATSVQAIDLPSPGISSSVIGSITSAPSVQSSDIPSHGIQPSEVERVGVTVLIGTEFRSGFVPLTRLAPYASEWKVGDQIVIPTDRVITYRNTGRMAGIVPAGTVGQIIEVTRLNVTVSFQLPQPLHSLQFPPWQVRKADGSDRIIGGSKGRISSSEPVPLIDANGQTIILLSDGQVVAVKKAAGN